MLSLDSHSAANASTRASVEFPAEWCAHDEPVSRLGGQVVLVTEFLMPAAPLKPGRPAALLGAMLGLLVVLPRPPVAG